MTDTFFPDDDHPFRYLDGRPLEDPAAVFELGELPDAPRVFSTRARLIDRLGEERTYGLFIPAKNIDEARLIARIRRLGEVITGEVVAVIPA